MSEDGQEQDHKYAQPFIISGGNTFIKVLLTQPLFSMLIEGLRWVPQG